MHAQLENEDLSESAEYHIRFALGKAYEDKKDYDAAWKYYHSGNQLKRTEVFTTLCMRKSALAILPKYSVVIFLNRIPAVVLKPMTRS